MYLKKRYSDVLWITSHTNKHASYQSQQTSQQIDIIKQIYTMLQKLTAQSNVQLLQLLNYPGTSLEVCWTGILSALFVCDGVVPSVFGSTYQLVRGKVVY